MRLTAKQALPAFVVLIAAAACAQGPSPRAVPTQAPTPTPFPLAALGWEDVVVRDLCVKVEQSFADGEGGEPEPIVEAIREILAGIGVNVRYEGGTCDADMVVRLRLEAVGAKYTGPRYCYSGSRTEGEMVLSATGYPTLTLSILGRFPAQEEIVSCASEAKDAPFSVAYREALIAGLADIWGPQVFIWALSQESLHVRRAAAQRLAQAGPDEAVVDGLMDALHDSDRQVRAAAADSLGEIGPEASKAASALAECLADREWVVRYGATRALASFGPSARIAVPALVDALSDPMLRDEVLVALRAISGQDLGEDATEWRRWWEEQGGE